MMARELIFLVFAALCAWQDIRHRSVPVFLFVIFGIIALAMALAAGDLMECFYGSLIGAGLLLLSYLSQGAVGAGDGLFFAVAGLLLKASEDFRLLCTTIFICGVSSLFIFVFRRVEDACFAGKDTIPLLPFAAAAGAFLFITGL